MRAGSSGGSNVVVLVLVVVTIVDVELGSDVVLVSVVLVVVAPDTSLRLRSPARLAAPGPGKPAAPSITKLPVAGMQKADARSAGLPASWRGPAGSPSSANSRQAGLLKHPALPLSWSGQNTPSVALRCEGEVASGVRSIGRLPRTELPSLPPGGQS